MNYRCPCCNRLFEKMQDYPLVLVQRVDVLAIPEVMDYWSEEAARVRLIRAQSLGDESLKRPGELTGINRTPEVALAYQSEVLQSYFRMLKAFEGQEVVPEKLAPQFGPDKYFRWAYPLAGSGLYISLAEAEPDTAERVCQVTFHGKGPNLGSAGGPTLQKLGPVAAIHYEGRILWQGRSIPDTGCNGDSA